MKLSSVLAVGSLALVAVACVPPGAGQSEVASANDPAKANEPAAPGASAPEAPQAKAGSTPEAAGPAAKNAAVSATDASFKFKGKTEKMTELEIKKEGDEFFFYAHTANEEGFGVSLGKELSEGKKVTKSGVTAHIKEGGKKVNMGDSSTITVEMTGFQLGTWEKPGKCSGRFNAEIKVKGETVQASGTFKDIPCMKI